MFIVKTIQFHLHNFWKQSWTDINDWDIWYWQNISLQIWNRSWLKTNEKGKFLLCSSHTKNNGYMILTTSFPRSCRLVHSVKEFKKQNNVNLFFKSCTLEKQRSSTALKIIFLLVSITFANDHFELYLCLYMWLLSRSRTMQEQSAFSASLVGGMGSWSEYISVNI